jgi:TFIIF-interacting CTD phosphatase-like protein
MPRSTGLGPHRFGPLTWDAGFSSKNLKRLFPTDQSMVVVIDDRSDVWGDIPNLVKVVPCERHSDVPSSYLHTTADHSTTDHSNVLC